MLVAVGNGTQYGGGMKVCPGALLDDGLLVGHVPRRAAHAHLPAGLPEGLQAARTSARPEVHEHTGDTVRLDAPGQVAYADGERIGPLPVEVRVDARRGAPAGRRRPDRPADIAWRHDLARRALRRLPPPGSARRARRWTSSGGLYDFELDEFQLEACRALEEGAGVLVAAPTGAGKTVVGEFAVHLALREGRKCFYTAPIKALSNQKYHDLVARYGADKVGLLTGDNSVNGEAPVVVMTTEVLRNMLYAGSHTLDGLSYVVMDEVHYLADRFRGAVWEEVIIHLPEHVAVVALSATVSNAEEFGEWLTDRARRHARSSSRSTGRCRCGSTSWPATGSTTCSSTTTRRAVNPELVRLAREDDRLAKMTRESTARRRRAGRRPAPRPRRARPRGVNVPLRFEVVERLEPRAAAARDHVHLQPRRLRGGRRAVPRGRAAAHLATTSALRIREHRRGALRRPAAGGPAGARLRRVARRPRARVRRAPRRACSRPSRRPSRSCSSRAWSRWCSPPRRSRSASTCRPARVVLEKLVKWNGETHADVTPGEYTQLTGRAGRRGIDVEGNAVVVWHQGFDPAALAGLASTRTYPLRSSFKPSYNMAVNLVGSVGHHAARELLETSFAQFQADRAVVGLATPGAQARGGARRLPRRDGRATSATSRSTPTCGAGSPTARRSSPATAPPAAAPRPRRRSRRSSPAT